MHYPDEPTGDRETKTCRDMVNNNNNKNLNSDNPFASCKHEYLFELISFQIQSFG